MKSDTIQCRNSLRGENDFEGLDGAVEVLVIDGVFIVVHPGIWSCHLVTNKENAVVSRIRFTLVYCCSRPGHDARLLSVGGANRSKSERWVDSGHGVLLVRSVVIHVAFRGMRLAPGAFVRYDVIRFSKIRRPGV